MSRWKPDVYSYLSYRQYLGDYYAAAKDNVPAFSYRAFSKKAGFASTNFIKLVIDGQRNLGAESIAALTEAMELRAGQGRFFADLVEFEQAPDHDARNEAFQKLMASRRFRDARFVDQAMFQYLSHWYFPAIREMVARADFVEEPEWIARQLLPAITVYQASQALEVLVALGLVVRDETGRLNRGEPALTAGHEIEALAARNYHRQMLERASESMELVPRELRDLSALTVSVEASSVPELKAQIHRMREAMIARSDADTHPTVVYQVNVQMFPLSVGPSEAAE